MSHTPSRTLVIALALSLTIPLVPLTSDSARAQGDCQALRTRPLWISNVTVFDLDPDEDDETFVQAHGNGSVYAEQGTELGALVDVENRYPEGCLLGTGDLTNELRIQVRYVNDPGPGDPGADDVHVSQRPLSCASQLTPQQSCETFVRLPSSVGGEVAGPEGEHRLRVLVYDADAETDHSDANLGDDDPTPVNDPDNCANTEQTLVGDPGACAGAERVIVVDRLPDLSIGDITWVTPEDERVTAYDPGTFSTFATELDNQGDYPTWNPNGDLDGPEPYYGRSSWDSTDGDAEPDELQGDGEAERRFEQSYATDDPGPICRWTGSPQDTSDGDLQPWEYPCSYRRGQLLQAPIHHTVRREPDGPSIENRTTRAFADLEGDKADALQAGTTQPVELQALDRYKRGGVFQLEAQAARTTDESFVPETNETNNAATMSPSPELLAADLGIADPRVFVETADGVQAPPACPEDDPCPPGTLVLLDPKFANVGDPELDGTTLLDREWIGAVWHNGQDVENETVDEVPDTDEEAERLFILEEILDLDRPGKHTVQIRLDHRENYQGRDITVAHPNGRVGERTEGNDCPASTEEIDNTYCATFWIEDTHPPDIESTTVETNHTVDGVSTVIAGEQARFEAVVTDHNLEDVTAVFFHLDGTNATLARPDGTSFHELDLEPVDGEQDTFAAATRIQGPAERLVYRVEATDGVHTVHSLGTEFDVVDEVVDLDVQHLDVDRRSTGEHEVSFSARNAGERTAGIVDVEAEACPDDALARLGPLAGCEQLLDAAASQLEPGRRLFYDVRWETADNVGTWEVCASLDAPGADLEHPTTNNEDCQRVDLTP